MAQQGHLSTASGASFGFQGAKCQKRSARKSQLIDVPSIMPCATSRPSTLARMPRETS